MHLIPVILFEDASRISAQRRRGEQTMIGMFWSWSNATKRREYTAFPSAHLLHMHNHREHGVYGSELWIRYFH
jgi:hypothetical protein